MSNLTSKLTLFCLLLIAFSVSAHPTFGQDDDKQWFSAAVELDDAKLYSLRQSGFLKIPLPPNYINHVDAVILKRPTFFKEEKATEFPNVERFGSAVQFNVDESILDQIDYQAVELRIYESDFNTILIRYVGGGPSSRAKLSLAGSAKRDSPVVRVRLRSGKEISGRIRALQEIPIVSVMGDVDVKMNETSLISIDESNDANLSFSMRNGDTISGEVNFREFELLTRWGTEVLDLEKVSSIAVSESNGFAPANGNQQMMMPQGPPQPMFPTHNPFGMHVMPNLPQAYPMQAMPMMPTTVVMPLTTNNHNRHHRILGHRHQNSHATAVAIPVPAMGPYIQNPTLNQNAFPNGFNGQQNSADGFGAGFPWTMQSIWNNPTMNY